MRKEARFLFLKIKQLENLAVNSHVPYSNISVSFGRLGYVGCTFLKMYNRG